MSEGVTMLLGLHISHSKGIESVDFDTGKKARTLKQVEVIFLVQIDIAYC